MIERRGKDWLNTTSTISTSGQFAQSFIASTDGRSN
jgi:hypothetical protein